MNITVEGADAVVADLEGMSAKMMRGAVFAMNRAITQGRTVMSREIARDTGLNVGVVRKALPISQATLERAEAAFRAGFTRIPLIDFKAKGPEPSRGRGRGVSYRLPTGKGRLPDAFLATMESGHRGVFRRAGKAGSRTGRVMGALSQRKSRGAWSPNLPIVELYGPSLGHVFAKYRPMGMARTKEAFDTEFAHQMKRLLLKGTFSEGPFSE
jgi:hypothetical protein